MNGTTRARVRVTGDGGVNGATRARVRVAAAGIAGRAPQVRGAEFARAHVQRGQR
ncbi:hypothetical protein ACFWYW_17080 [Nonomuraea sp. NPDC059023]|uniref:hypothetical protein n=1 Tax=unclassified Nonomuraea TaxID=2593643 RepID=UPI0036C0734D